MYYLITAAWIATMAMSWADGNRIIPLTVAGIGLLAQVAIWYGGLGALGMGVLAICAGLCMLTVPRIFFRRR